jgi:3-oxoacid CoA-transferase B subunit
MSHLHGRDPREVIARRCAQELRNGEVVNLGIGIPTMTANFLPPGVSVIFHTENGAFGFGPKPATLEADSDISNASNEPVTLLPGAAIMDLATSQGAMRNGYIATSVLGALEVDQEGNLANWASKRQGKWWPGIGGAWTSATASPASSPPSSTPTNTATPRSGRRRTSPSPAKPASRPSSPTTPSSTSAPTT